MKTRTFGLHQKAQARWALAAAMQAAGHPNWARHHIDMAVRHEQELGRLRRSEVAPATATTR